MTLKIIQFNFVQNTFKNKIDIKQLKMLLNKFRSKYFP